jgi:hypothetical protein
MVEGHAFRHRFLPAYAAIMACTFPIAVLGAAVDLGFTEHPWKCAVFLVFIAILGAVLTLTWTRMLVTVSPAGLHCSTSAGTYQLVEWRAMGGIRPTRMLLGLPYFRIRCVDGRPPLWLPLFLVDMPRFVTLVSTYAGPEHPLSVSPRGRIGQRRLQI